MPRWKLIFIQNSSISTNLFSFVVIYSSVYTRLNIVKIGDLPAEVINK